ncbi:hypothetical protein [Metabacillus arenae]|uniref:Uncharacterized protein n=1 Tax=Metabacillus arenae TaxID=2771434 RepID=A0A926NDA7_9BACI|nr:hypothetical protein [Metabacillus arenae]MBD1379121.1 hypothetical protein [Metabacillus arenae]
MEITIVASDFKIVSNKIVAKNLLRIPDDIKVSFATGKTTLNVLFDSKSLTRAIKDLEKAANDLKSMQQLTIHKNQLTAKKDFLNLMDQFYSMAKVYGFTHDEIMNYAYESYLGLSGESSNKRKIRKAEEFL